MKMSPSNKVRIVLDAATYAVQPSDSPYIDPLDILQEATGCLDALLSLPLQLAEGKDVFNGKLQTKDPLVRYPLGRFYSKIHPLFLLADSPEAQYPNMAFFFRQYALESGALTESELPPLPSEMLNGDCGYEYLVRTTNIDGQSDLATLIGEGTITSIRTSVIQKLHKEATSLLQSVAQGQKNTPEQMQDEGKSDADPITPLKGKGPGSCSATLYVPRSPDAEGLGNSVFPEKEEALASFLRDIHEGMGYRDASSVKKSTLVGAEEDDHSGEKSDLSPISQKQADILGVHELQLKHLAQKVDLLEEALAKLREFVIPKLRGPSESKPALRSASLPVVALLSHWASDSLGVFFDHGEYNSATPISRAKVTYTEGKGWGIEEIKE